MSDLISKQKVLATLDFADNALTDEERTVENYKKLLTECIKVLPSAENDGDLISRQAVLDGIAEWIVSGYADSEADCSHISSLVTHLPSVENRGEWKMPIQDDGMSDPIYYQVRCSKCGFDLDPQTWHQELHQYGADNFCPNCGADMRGE